MPLTSQQLKRIMSTRGQAFVPRDVMNYAGRVTETYLRKKLYRFEDRAALEAYKLLKYTMGSIREYALGTASNLRIDKVGNDAASIAFRRTVGNYATQQLVNYGQRVAVMGYQYAVTAYAAGWYGRQWQLWEASHHDKRVTFERLPKSKAESSVLTPGLTEAIQADLNAYDYLGDTWRDNFTLAVNASIAKVKRVLNSTVSNPQSVLPLMTEVATTLGIDTTAKESAKGLYHAVQLPIRTAVMRSANHASAEVYKTHTELLLGAMWVTSNDHRVCPVCSRQNGRIFIINSLVGIALFGLPPDGSHFGCRCTIIPLMIPVERANEPPQDSFDEWLDEWGFADELNFFMDDTVLESTQL